IAPSQVGWYLERGYDRVSGFVHRAQEVAHLKTPSALVAGLGLRYDGSPFDPEAEEVFVLRWQAYCPHLYRIPYGGRTEAAMAAMQGWVIERAPFRGNGFAPADSGDVIAEFKVDSIRLPHGAELWRLSRDGDQRLVAVGLSWRRAEESCWATVTWPAVAAWTTRPARTATRCGCTGPPRRTASPRSGRAATSGWCRWPSWRACRTSARCACGGGSRS